MRILVSACLLGCNCRYDGGNNARPEVIALANHPDVELIPVCPEQLGGLCTPRTPSERRNGGVFARDGTDVTANFVRGCSETLALSRAFSCKAALLKLRSPSCGVGHIYDGSFTSRLIPGDGVTAQALRQAGLAVFGENQVDELLEFVEKPRNFT